MDLLWRAKVIGANFVWTMNGTTYTGTVPLLSETTLTWDICGTGDFNSDGKPDIFWRHKVDGRDSVWIRDSLARAEPLNITRVSDNNWKIEN